MAHYAILDENNVVIDVFVGLDEGQDGVDWEQWYSEFRGQTCKRTSYNTIAGKHLYDGVPFRKNYAHIGGTYDPVRDAFIPPKDFPSWTLDEETCLWKAPIPKPVDAYLPRWDENNQIWIVVNKG